MATDMRDWALQEQDPMRRERLNFLAELNQSFSPAPTQAPSQVPRSSARTAPHAETRNKAEREGRAWGPETPQQRRQAEGRPKADNGGAAYADKKDNDRAIADYVANPVDRAIADDSEAIRLNPNDARAYNRRGFHYMAKGDNDRAIHDYNEVIRLNPSDASAHLRTTRTITESRSAGVRLCDSGEGDS